MKKLLTPLLSLFSIAAFAQTANLDPNFGSAGTAITPQTSEINRIATDGNGFIFSAGYKLASGGTGIYHLTVTKHTGSGALDPNFGTNGIATTIIDHSEFPLGIALQPDGKILVCGSVYLGPTPNGPGDYNSFVVRYKTNGQLDSSFAINGVLKLPYSDSHLTSMILLSDGSVLLAGNSYSAGSITKIHANGTVIPAFGNNGSVYLSGANFQFVLWDAVLLSDQTIVCAGYDASDAGNSKLAYCKVDMNGNFVPAFGQNGKVVLDLHNTMPEVSEYLSHVKQAASGDVFLGGQSAGAIILKVNPANGSLNTNFGNNGILHHTYPFADLEIQPDGKFLIGGSHEVTPYNAGFSVTRLNSDGSPDLSFNGTGTFTADISNGNDYLQTLKLIGTNSILVGGSSRPTGSEASSMLAKIVIGGNLNVHEISAEEIAVYPNPFSDELFFSVPDGETFEVRLADAAGRTIASLQTGEGKLSLAHLSKGTYQVIFRTKSGKTSYQTVVKY